MISVNELIENLKKGTVIIEFKKIDTGEIRIMPSTLKPELIPSNSRISNISSTSDTIMVWSLDKEAWRDIRVSTIIKWAAK
ncbi:MAG: DUF2693 domain-containing protein [SAR86 cluster bacterium]|nr:DUF2693 domain-containing protein [SAR86 cluster bacterium]